MALIDSPPSTQVATAISNRGATGNAFNTSSVRNVYNPEVTTSTELMVDQLAKTLGQDPYQLRRAFVRDSGG